MNPLLQQHLCLLKNALKRKISTIDIDQSDNRILALPFEYYCAIQLTLSTGNLIFQNDFITPEEKEEIGLPRIDLGVDLTDKKEMIGQVKLFNGSIKLGNISTFLASQISIKDGKPFIRWPNLILCRGSDSILSKNS